jgi:hypothetical protein
MLKMTAEAAVEIRDLGEMLAALGRVAQYAADTEGASQLVERSGLPHDFQSADERIGRS